MKIYKNKYLKYKKKYLDLKKIFVDMNMSLVELWADNFKEYYIIKYNIDNNIDNNINYKKKYNISKLTITRLEYKDEYGVIYYTDNFDNILTSLKDFNITGNLNLSNNKLQTLPPEFCNIIIGGDLNLSHNELQTLPEDFCSIKVGGNLNLAYNQLKTLPVYFENIKIGGNLNLEHNLLKILPENFSKISVGGELNLSYNLLKILPENFDNVNKNILLFNNYIISKPPYNCENNTGPKNYCHLDNQTIESLYEENKTCSQCNYRKKCKKCAICKKENIWYCSNECEIEAWANHSIVCNNIMNTTFIIVAHGVLWVTRKRIKNFNNISIITTSSIGTKAYSTFVDPIIDIYTNNKSLFNDDDKTLMISNSGKKITDDIFEGHNFTIKNRINEQNQLFNNIYLTFIDADWQEHMKIHCFKKHENQHIEIDHNYMYDIYNGKQLNSVQLINNIVKWERDNENNRGHITFIFISCRDFPFEENTDLNKTQRKKNKLMRSNSHKTQNYTNIATEGSEEENARKEQREIKAKEKQDKEILENQRADNMERILFNW